MKKIKANAIIKYFNLLALLLIFLGMGLFATSLSNLQSQLIEKFGRADPQLSFTQKMILSAVILTNEELLLQSQQKIQSEKNFTIAVGESTNSVIQRLEMEGLIPDAKSFRAYLQYTGMDKSLQAGKYTLSPMISPVNIALALQDATPTMISFNILAGWRLEEIAASLPTSGLSITPEQFLNAANYFPAKFIQSSEIPANASVEGFLMPGSYQIHRETQTNDLILILVEEFYRQLTDEIIQGIQQQNLTLYQAVIIASIVEREAVVKDEMPLIASVFLNRMHIDMKLDSDPTVQYALGYQSREKKWWKNPLTSTDLQYPSPHNTYIHKGLPPTPIANPSLEALRAVAFPKPSEYFYFRASCNHDGRHNFAKTYQEHIMNACP